MTEIECLWDPKGIISCTSAISLAGNRSGPLPFVIAPWSLPLPRWKPLSSIFETLKKLLKIAKIGGKFEPFRCCFHYMKVFPVVFLVQSCALCSQNGTVCFNFCRKFFLKKESSIAIDTSPNGLSRKSLKVWRHGRSPSRDSMVTLTANNDYST